MSTPILSALDGWLPILDTQRKTKSGDDPDVVEESHSHWAVGHIDGFSMRVFRDGEITEAYRTFHGLMESLAAYPILDEEDFSNREFEATVENIVDAAWRLRDDYDCRRTGSTKSTAGCRTTSAARSNAAVTKAATDKCTEGTI